MTSGGIFVCYRREDSAGHAGRLYDRLNRRFPGRVFMDVASIAVGTCWAEVIEQTLRSCHVAVILVGKHWLEIQPDGARRLDRDDDPTRAEISMALRLKLKIVPLLVAGAAMPDRGHLPAEIASVTEWQALRVDDDDFEHDATRLIRALETQLGESATLAEPVASEHSTAPSVSAHPTAGSGFNFKSPALWIAVATVVVALVVVQVVGLWPNSPSAPNAGTSPSISADAGTTPRTSSISPSGNDAGGTNRPAESGPHKGNAGSPGFRLAAEPTASSVRDSAGRSVFNGVVQFPRHSVSARWHPEVVTGGTPSPRSTPGSVGAILCVRDGDANPRGGGIPLSRS